MGIYSRKINDILFEIEYNLSYTPSTYNDEEDFNLTMDRVYMDGKEVEPSDMGIHYRDIADSLINYAYENR